MLIPSGGVGLGADGLGDDFDLGWPKFLKKAAGAVASAAKKAGSGVASVAKTGFNVVKAAHLIPLKLALKAASGATRLVCSAPQPLLQVASFQAKVPLPQVNLFCNAVRLQNFSQIKSLLPSAIKVTASLAATGALPGAGPALAVITKLVKIPGLSGADPEVLGAYVDQQLVELYDSIGDDDLRGAVLGTSPVVSAGPALLLLAGAAVAGYGIYCKAR